MTKRTCPICGERREPAYRFCHACIESWKSTVRKMKNGEEAEWAARRARAAERRRWKAAARDAVVRAGLTCDPDCLLRKRSRLSD